MTDPLTRRAEQAIEDLDADGLGYFARVVSDLQADRERLQQDLKSIAEAASEWRGELVIAKADLQHLREERDKLQDISEADYEYGNPADLAAEADMLRQRVAAADSRAESAEATIARLRALAEKWRTESGKQHHRATDDMTGGMWAYQHEASGQSRAYFTCADELLAALESK